MPNFKTIAPSVESVWSSLKAAVRNVNLPEVLNLPEGGRAVYYPAGSLTNEAGYKNMNASVVTLISPSGSRVNVENISAFCKDVFGVTEAGRPKFTSSFSELISGVRKEDNVMGWKLYQEDSVETQAA
jgi:hypothetical protein